MGLNIIEHDTRGRRPRRSSKITWLSAQTILLFSLAFHRGLFICHILRPTAYTDGTPVASVYLDAPHLSMLLEMDKIVGSIVLLIKEKGLENDTMVIFTSEMAA